MYADNLSPVLIPCACAYACVAPVYILLCLCLSRYVVSVNRDDASISTSASTRRLCLRRTGLQVRFLRLCFYFLEDLATTYLEGKVNLL